MGPAIRIFTRFRLAFYALLALLYAACAYASFGYDDEITNIWLIEHLGIGVVAHVQKGDVHPPGSYLVNWLLFTLLRDWSLVRVAIALFAAGSIAWLAEMTLRRSGALAGLLVLLLTGLNPGILMWCTGLRWYAILVPLSCLALAPIRTRGWIGWTWVFAALLAMAFTGYGALVAAPAILFLQWRRDPGTPREKLRRIVPLSAVCAVIYGWQAYIFLTVHNQSPAQAAQVGSLAKSLQMLVAAQFGNQGLFPLSPGAAIAALGAAGLGWLGAIAALKQRRLPEATLAWAASACILVVTGLGAKMRNFVLADPLRGMALAELFSFAGPRRWLAQTCLAMILIGNGIGVWNVATHSQTTKQSWNLPIKPMLDEVRAATARCHGQAAILAYEPVAVYWLKRQGYRVITPRVAASKGRRDEMTLPPNRQGIPDGKPECLLVLKSYMGYLGPAHVAAIEDMLTGLDSDRARHTFLGRDPDYRIKRKLDPSYPEYAFELIEPRGVEAQFRKSS